MIDPVQAGFGCFAKLFEQVDVACPAKGFREDQQVKNGGVGCPIIRRMGYDMEVRQLAKADFMQYPAARHDVFCFDFEDVCKIGAKF